MKLLLQFLIGAVLAFSSTFAGVYTASRIAETNKTSTERQTFNALFRVMSADCDYSLELLDDFMPSDKPVTMIEPSLLLSAMHTNPTAIDIVDVDRMSNLVKAVRRVTVAGSVYLDAAREHNHSFVVIKRTLSREEERQKEKSMKDVKGKHDQYKKELSDTCEIFKTIVQVN